MTTPDDLARLAEAALEDDAKARRYLFDARVPWSEHDGMVWDDSGDAIVSNSESIGPYIEPVVGRHIVSAVNGRAALARAVNELIEENERKDAEIEALLSERRKDAETLRLAREVWDARTSALDKSAEVARLREFEKWADRAAAYLRENADLESQTLVLRFDSLAARGGESDNRGGATE